MKFEKNDLLTITNRAYYKSKEKTFSNSRFHDEKWRSIMTESMPYEKLFDVKLFNANLRKDFSLECSIGDLSDIFECFGLKIGTKTRNLFSYYNETPGGPLIRKSEEERLQTNSRIADFLMTWGHDLDNPAYYSQNSVRIDLANKKLFANNRPGFFNTIKNSKDESIKYFHDDDQDRVEISGDDCIDKFINLTLEAYKTSDKIKNNGKGGKE